MGRHHRNALLEPRGCPRFKDTRVHIGMAKPYQGTIRTQQGHFHLRELDRHLLVVGNLALELPVSLHGTRSRWKGLHPKSPKHLE